MTLKNNSLSDRLNNFKNKIKQELEGNTSEVNSQTSSLSELYYSLISILAICAKSIIIGYSIKLVFHTDWTFLGLLCVGLSVDFIFHHIYSLIHGDK
jgi:hypothetical protein